ncbi:MAG TPA: tetratricopeptide repeat protein [Rhizomicrobium sp.]|nr:tetratricopeptide repeat protein [Rhizomicrobium sp.]
MADIFREVEEDVRRERYAQLWKKYGDYAVAVAAIVVIGVAGFELWQRYEARERTKASDQFIEATVAADPSQAAELFARLATTAPDGYAQLSKMDEAGALLASGQRDHALAIYKNIAGDSASPFSEVARIREGWALADTDTAEELTTLLAPLTDPANPWHSMANEILAYAHYREGDTARALTTFQVLAKDTNAPAGIRARANAMATFIAAGGAKDVGTVPPLQPKVMLPAQQAQPAAPQTTPSR